jgi:hypothetical protein
MLSDPPKITLIVRRLSDGSFQFVENQDSRKCDLDGAELWTTPSGQHYCDEVHANRDNLRSVPAGERSNKPHEISTEEWSEIIALTVVRECWGLDEATTPEDFAEMAYGVRFDFVSGGPGYVGDLYILSGDAIGEPLTLVRRDGNLEVV